MKFSRSRIQTSKIQLCFIFPIPLNIWHFLPIPSLILPWSLCKDCLYHAKCHKYHIYDIVPPYTHVILMYFRHLYSYRLTNFNRSFAQIGENQVNDRENKTYSSGAESGADFLSARFICTPLIVEESGLLMKLYSFLCTKNKYKK